MIRRKYPPLVYGYKRFLFERIKLANDDFFYNDLVKLIEDDLIKFIFDARGDEARKMEFDYTWPYPVDPEVFDDWYSKSFIVSMSVYPNDDISAPVNVPAEAGVDEAGFGLVEVSVEYKPGTDLSDHYQFIVSELRGALAHEIHHLTQEEPLQRPDCPELPERKTEDDGYAVYFTSACEVPAFVVGFRGNANALDVPVRDLMRSYLDNYVKIDALTPKESDEVFDVWTSHRFA